MLKLDLKVNIDEVTRELGSAFTRQIQFAVASATTNVAKSSREAVKRNLDSVFNNPTSFIRNSAFATPATKETLTAVVGIKDQGARATPAHYLKEHITAGERGSKPMERAMRALGVLPDGWLAVPSKDGVKRDAYGNVSKATVARILGALKQKETAKRGSDTFRVFVVRPGMQASRTRRLAPGIWSVSNIGGQSVVKPVFLFVEAATYRKVFDLPKIVEDVVRTEFGRHLSSAIDRAMRTAR